MAGKWAWLRGKFPTLPDDPQYEDVLRAARDTHRAEPLSKLIEIYNAKRDQKDRITRDLEDVNVDITALEQLIDSVMDTQGIENVTIGGFRFTRKPEPVVSVTDRPALLEWALAHMRDNLALHHSTLTAVVKRALESGEELLPGVEVNVRPTVSRTKA